MVIDWFVLAAKVLYVEHRKKAASRPRTNARDSSRHKNIAVVVSREAIGVVALQTFPQLRRDRIGQARLECFVVERGDLHGAAAWSVARCRPEAITGATAETQQQKTKE